MILCLQFQPRVLSSTYPVRIQSHGGTNNRNTIPHTFRGPERCLNWNFRTQPSKLLIYSLPGNRKRSEIERIVMVSVGVPRVSRKALNPTTEALEVQKTTLQTLPIEIRFSIFDRCLLPSRRVISLTATPHKFSCLPLLIICKQFKDEIETWLKTQPHIISEHFGLLNPGKTLFTIVLSDDYRQQASDLRLGDDVDNGYKSNARPWGKWSWIRLGIDFQHIRHVELKLDSPDLVKGATTSLLQTWREKYVEWYRDTVAQRGSHDNSWAIHWIANRLHALETLHVLVPWYFGFCRTGVDFPFGKFENGYFVGVIFRLMQEEAKEWKKNVQADQQLLITYSSTEHHVLQREYLTYITRSNQG